jgi:hypothetical protein
VGEEGGIEAFSLALTLRVWVGWWRVNPNFSFRTEFYANVRTTASRAAPLLFPDSTALQPYATPA